MGTSRVIRSFGIVVLSIGLWELVYWAVDGVGFAHSWQVAAALVSLSAQADFWLNVVTTLAMTVAGLSLGVVVSVLMGAVLGATQFLQQSTRGTLYFLRSIPSVALLPLLMATVGSRTGIVVALVTLVVSLKMMVFVLRGFGDLAPEYRDQSRILSLSPVTRLLGVQLPAALAIIATGIRLSANRAYGAVILGGLLAGTPGIGNALNVARMNGESATLLALAVVAGLVGVWFFTVIRGLERRLVPWRVVT